MEDYNFEKWSCLGREKEQYSLSKRDIRRWYQRDIDQITHSINFRKLQRKSQLLSEKDPRSRSRMIHTIEVSRIAMEISEKLGLSKELTEAICLTHDIGTSPYGCIGNKFLQENAKQPFSHEMAGALMLLMISQKEIIDEDQQSDIEALISKEGFRGEAQIKIDKFPNALYVSRSVDSKQGDKYYSYHISPEIVDGVYNHGASGIPDTIEGQVVQFADNIAYLSQDIEDLIATKIIQKRNFVKFGSQNQKVGTKFWSEIDILEDASLKDAFNETRGRRIAAFINRFVKHNLHQLSENNLKFRDSKILEMKIPVLEYDEGLRFVVDFIWDLIEQQYEHPLIKTSNNIQIAKMNQLWNILGSSEFGSKNNSYKNFIDKIAKNSLFEAFGESWKQAFFISHLSWFDVDLIIDSYHERNYAFELDICD